MAKTKYIGVKIPTHPYLRKFAHARYGETLFANYSNPLGIIISLSLDKNMYDTRHSCKNLFDDSMTVFINIWQRDNIGYDIPPDKVKIINRFLDRQFCEKLNDHVEKHIGNSINRYKGYNEVYEAFADKYGIVLDEDIDRETLKKKEYRYRVEILQEQAKTVNSGLLF